MSKLFRNIFFILIFLSPTIVNAVSLNVPFTSQAPIGDWRQPWLDACEEANILMVDRYYRGDRSETIDKEQAVKELLQIIKIKENYYGHSLDESAEKIINIINNFFTWEARIVPSPSIDEIKKEIDNGKPVILPVSGKELQNPFFRNGGPDFHTVVIIGYDDIKKEFITQEPGTIRGNRFRYSYNILMDAMHDLLSGRTKLGPKLAIFTSPKITHSKLLDADRDGLTKIDEIKHGTILWLKDSDGDGYSDGTEINNDHSPTFSPKLNPPGTLIKANNSPKIYLVKDSKTILYISKPSYFTQTKRNWNEVRTLTPTIINSLIKVF